jgi:hypothetical protein
MKKRARHARSMILAPPSWANWTGIQVDGSGIERPGEAEFYRDVEVGRNLRNTSRKNTGAKRGRPKGKPDDIELLKDFEKRRAKAPNLKPTAIMKNMARALGRKFPTVRDAIKRAKETRR